MPLASLHWFQDQMRSVLNVLAGLSYRDGDLAPFLQEIARAVGELLATDWSIVTVCKDGQGEVLASSTELDDDEDMTFSVHGTILENVLRTGQAFTVDDAWAHPECGVIDEGYRAYMGVPLRISTGDIIGTICSFQRHPRQFTPDEIQLVEIFAERAATAIDNYQLYQQQRLFNENLESVVVQRTLTLRAVQAKLIVLNNQLEQKVEQRTAELQQANQQLHAEIWERQQTEEALRQSEEQLRQIAENMKQVLWMYSSDGDPIYVSPAFESIWRRPRQDWYTNPAIWYDSIHPDDRERVVAAFQTAMEGTFCEEYRIIAADGTVRLILDQAFPIRNGSGQVYRLAGIAEDITERKQTEQTMMQAMSSLAEVGELAAMIVHEIRNPLTTIWMGLQSFDRMELPEPARERLTLALSEGERLRNLLNEILVYAKPQALQRCSFELNAFLSELLSNLGNMSWALNRQLRFVPSASSVLIEGDRNKLKQVFINLINNACEAISEGDAVTISLEPFAHTVHVRIHNGGTPIPAEALCMLTKPFYTTKPAGTGLGLPIVKRIVEAHRGVLTITSSLATGTLVDVQLPLAIHTRYVL